MRAPNAEDAGIALRLYDLRREPELRKARQMVATHLMGRPWDEVRPVLDHAHPENAHLRQVVGYWELSASFVNRGILHPDVWLDACEEALYLFAVLEPHLARIRERRPRYLGQVERVAASHPAAAERLAEIRARLVPA